MAIHLVRRLATSLSLYRKEWSEGVGKNSDDHCDYALRSAIYTHGTRILSERIVKRSKVLV